MNSSGQNILCKIISNEPNEYESHSEETDIHNENIQNKRRGTTKYSTNHTLQRKRQRKGLGRKHL